MNPAKSLKSIKPTLSQKLGFDADLSSPMALAAFYHQQKMEFQYSKRVNYIGFKAINGN